ncbi:MAG TPA: GNAT family N-acetyltransferase [Bacillales bacterium]|nr:GNAT family N-acetyltransferase [Bacillales bacterium]
MIWERGPLTVRELRDSDEKDLIKWMSDPEVLAFYEGRDQPHDSELVQKHFYQKDDRVTPCLILFHEAPTGYIQFYSLSEKEAQAYGYTNEKRIFGMDQFIGESAYWNQGVGTTLVSTMAHYLCSELGAQKVVMDPQAWNRRAIRCYEKSGFRSVRMLPKHEFHEGKWRDCLLMEYVCKGR